MESIQKDVECPSGILNGRFRILKTGIRLHGVERADKILLSCCAIHNCLVEVDCLDENWEQGVPTNWEGVLGLLDQCDVDEYITPFACCRLNSPSLGRSFQTYDTYGMGFGSDRLRSHDANTLMETENLVNEAIEKENSGANVNPTNLNVPLVRNLSMV
jgi:Plant transposon protein